VNVAVSVPQSGSGLPQSPLLLSPPGHDLRGTAGFACDALFASTPSWDPSLTPPHPLLPAALSGGNPVYAAPARDNPSNGLPTQGNPAHAGPCLQAPPSPNPPSNLQRELDVVFNQGLNIAPEKVGCQKKGKWATIESKGLIAILDNGDNYARMQRNPKRFWENVARDTGFFRGSRSPNAIRAHWSVMIKLYKEVKPLVDNHIEGRTTDGQRASMESGWMKTSGYPVYSY